MQKVEDGVPQGLVLDPLLFLLYMNDFPNVSNLETTLFADDTNLRLSHQNLTIQNQVKAEINKIDTWIKLNKLTTNYKKSCFMIVSKKTTRVTNFEVTISQNTDKTN